MQDASDMQADGYVIILAAGEINNLPLQILNTIIVHVSNLIKMQLCCIDLQSSTLGILGNLK